MICDRDTMPAAHRAAREAGRQRRRDDARLCQEPIALCGLPPMLRWYVVVGVAALVALALVAMGVVG